MKYDIVHSTTYQYTEPVSLCQNLVHLQPRICPNQKCLRADLAIEPAPGPMQKFDDFFGNPVASFTIERPHRRLKIAARFQVAVHAAPTVHLAETQPWERVRDLVRDDTSAQALEALQYTFDSSYVKSSNPLAEFAHPSFPPAAPLLQAVLDLTHRIHREFVYDPKATTLSTPLKEVLEKRRGVCQDFAHLQIGCLRCLGLPVRYVSGYLLTRPAPGKPRLVGTDASHAWVSVWCPPLGWIDVDPTNGLMPIDTHITLAWGRDYDDVSPIKGVILGGGSPSMEVAVHVEASADHLP